MAPNSRPPSLPVIPDIALDLDEKTRLLPELEEVFSSTGETCTTFEEDDEYRPTRSHSINTQNSYQHRRIVFPSRIPSTSSSAPTTYTTLPLSPRHYDITCQVQPLQLPPTQKKVFESWTITYHHPAPRPRRPGLLARALFRLFDTAWSSSSTSEQEGGSILSVVPNTHFSQVELAATVAMHEAAVAAGVSRKQQQLKRGLLWGGLSGQQPKRQRTLCKPKLVGSSDSNGASTEKRGNEGVRRCSGGDEGGSWDAVIYAAELERRIRQLDWKVQDEVYELLSDRVQSSSNAFRRREWRVVVLTEVPGGELTDQPTGFQGFGETESRWFSGRDNKKRRQHEMPVTEYRLILRGTETRTNDQGWPHYNRYSRPWRDADEKELGYRRRWSTMTARNDKYVDF
ncbi:hypothetical protein C7999DRAFT_30333 [Corynascus novoguineensis]|uniref:Uncharacterized protein n=1 Tax=Corynascus novoguineensis TaxID=1126955 RepID=A0AAN7CYJ2_9PEZI|nr:hypothetical protein C7999DRAFT_30333 [Corynascus novoguineensis]